MSSKTVKIFYSNYFLYLIIAKKIFDYSKKDRRFCCKFTYLFVVPKQGAVDALPFPAGGNPTAIICPKGKLTNDGIWEFWKNPCRGYAALRVRLRPHQYENGTHNCSEFIFRTTKTGGSRGFAVSRRRESYGKNLPEGQIDERRHLDVFGKSLSGLCRVTSPFTPPPIAKKDRRFCCKFTYLFVVPKQGAVEALPFPASGSPTAKICPYGKLTNDGIWRFSENPCRGYAALRVRLRPTNTKTARLIALNSLIRTTKTGGR